MVKLWWKSGMIRVCQAWLLFLAKAGWRLITRTLSRLIHRTFRLIRKIIIKIKLMIAINLHMMYSCDFPGSRSRGRLCLFKKILKLLNILIKLWIEQLDMYNTNVFNALWRRKVLIVKVWAKGGKSHMHDQCSDRQSWNNRSHKQCLAH